MIWTLLIIYWVILGAFSVSILFFRNFSNHQLLGITISKAHADTSEVKMILKSYQIASVIQFFALFSAGFLMLWEPVKAFADFYMLFLIIILFVVFGIIFKIYQNKLITLKEKNKWIYATKPTVVVDLTASREKGKSAVSVIWSWLFVVLSFIPTIYLILNPEEQKYFPVIFSLLGPAIQLLTVLMYKQALNRHAPVLSDNSEMNKALARKEERINSLAASLTGLVMLVFWLTFSTSMAFISDFMVGIIAIVFMIISVLGIAYWQMKKIHQAEAYFFEHSEGGLLDDEAIGANIYEQGNLWRWGFYYNPNDSRLFVPKQISGMGWTINIARPIGKIVMACTCLIVVGAIGITVASSVTGYDIQEKNSQVTVSSVMYHSTFSPDDIISVDVITEIPNSTRTNGYGGTNKSSGHFSVDGYGPCMFYIYNNVDKYIVLHLKGDGPEYVFVNGKDMDKTNEIYQYFIDLAK